MDPLPRRRFVMAGVLTSVSVVDVYDQAAGIGKEFEKLIEAYGVEAITSLMPKVIRALEHLEALASKYEQENTEITELKFFVDKLEAEKAERAQERARYEEELEQIEQGWHQENKDLWTTIDRLQADNRRLKESCREQKQAAVEELVYASKKTEEEEIRMLTKLKETIDKQREEVRKHKREVKQKIVDCDALQTQLEQVIKVNADLRRKNTTQQKHACSLLEEKLDLETQLLEKEDQIMQISDSLKEQDDSVEKKEGSYESYPDSEEGEVTSDNDHPLAGAIETEEDEETYLHKLSEKLNLLGKVVIDLKDPSRPRFTLHELRTVMMERNEMKAKLMEVVNELAALKPPNIQCDNADSVGDNMEIIDQDDGELTYSGEECSLQGPINREPDDKLHPSKKKSGIRRFFNFVFGSTGNLRSSTLT